jgi:hypothetical protein
VKEFWEVLIPILLSVFGGGLLLAIVIALLPNAPAAIENWAALVWKVIYKIFRVGHRRYVKLDLESKVNDFVQRLAKEVPAVGDTRCSIEWVGPNLDRAAFLREGKVVVRLRKDDRREDNFIHGAHMYVATSLLHGVKRYLSQSQRESIDLFVTLKLLEREKVHLREIFLDEYVHPRASKSEKLGPLLEVSEEIDRSGLYFPLLLQELHFLGNKVFGHPQSAVIIGEVSDLYEYLGDRAIRKTSDEAEEKYFARNYCKMAIVIVGKSAKIAGGGGTWTRYIQRELVPAGIESVYLVGAVYNADVIREVAASLAASYETYRECQEESILRDSQGSEFRAMTHLLVLRKHGAVAIQTPSRG